MFLYIYQVIRCLHLSIKYMNKMRLNPQFGFQTPVSYIVSSGLLEMLEAITQLPGVNINKPDNEGNTPLHFAAQAGKNVISKVKC
jgi:hypothetical protein